jgi:hypothetical protein
MAEEDQVLARWKTTGSETLTRISFSSYLEGWRLTGVLGSVILLVALAAIVSASAIDTLSQMPDALHRRKRGRSSSNCRTSPAHRAKRCRSVAATECH